MKSQKKWKLQCLMSSSSNNKKSCPLNAFQERNLKQKWHQGFPTDLSPHHRYPSVGMVRKNARKMTQSEAETRQMPWEKCRRESHVPISVVTHVLSHGMWEVRAESMGKRLVSGSSSRTQWIQAQLSHNGVKRNVFKQEKGFLFYMFNISKCVWNLREFKVPG